MLTKKKQNLSNAIFIYFGCKVKLWGTIIKKIFFNIITSSVCFPVGIKFKLVSEVHLKPQSLSNTKYSNIFQVNLLAVVSHPYPVLLICCLFSFLYRRCRKTGILSYLIVKIYPELPCHYPWGHLLPTTRTPLSLFKKCQTKVKEMLWKEPFKVSVSGHKLFGMVVFFCFVFPPQCEDPFKQQPL